MPSDFRFFEIRCALRFSGYGQISTLFCNVALYLNMFSKDHLQKLDKLADDWVAVDINPDTKQEIADLKKRGDYEKLNEKLYHRIAFGTAGLRGQMTSGFSFMNDVTILQASQGLVQYLIQENPGKTPSLVVGYDHRFHSQRFAEISAGVAIAKGLKVYYLGSITNLSSESLGGAESNGDRLFVHTPLVPFAVNHFKASAGVMVTASHNPAQDNGYKVYYSNGCQIIPPHDTGIAHSIEKNLEPWSHLKVWDIEGHFHKGIADNLLLSVKKETTDAYLEGVKTKLVKTRKLSFDFVYTPIHGIGLEIFDKVYGLFEGNGFVSVKEQIVPDPRFSTVSFPNPEEKGALELAIKTADRKGYKLVVANDPDADRFSVAIKTSKGWQQLTGNEIGFLFAMYVIEAIPQSELSNVYLVDSTVSSQVLKSMAEKDGFHFVDTLTGFKWIGNKSIDLKQDGYRVPFAYEEAIGFMFELLDDKDGISAAAVFLQLYEKWFSSGQLDPIAKLHEGYEKYGWFKECNGYYKLDDLSKTDAIFTHVRESFSGDQPQSIGEFKVNSWRDLTLGYDSSTKDHKPVLYTDPTSQMITATVENSRGDVARFTCRGSGTEPKLKVYIEGKAGTERAAHEVAQNCWKSLKIHWFKPEANGIEEVVSIK